MVMQIYSRFNGYNYFSNPALASVAGLAGGEITKLELLSLLERKFQQYCQSLNRDGSLSAVPYGAMIVIPKTITTVFATTSNKQTNIKDVTKQLEDAGFLQVKGLTDVVNYNMNSKTKVTLWRFDY